MIRAVSGAFSLANKVVGRAWCTKYHIYLRKSSNVLLLKTSARAATKSINDLKLPVLCLMSSKIKSLARSWTAACPSWVGGGVNAIETTASALSASNTVPTSLERARLKRLNRHGHRQKGEEGGGRRRCKRGRQGVRQLQCCNINALLNGEKKDE